MHETLQKHGYDPLKWEIRSLPIVHSTNDTISHLFDLEVDKTIVLSQTQERGRGRGENRWESPAGGIWLSIGRRGCYRPSELSSPIVHAINSILSKYVGCIVKYPNDILIEEKKLCGVLVETKVISERMCDIIVGVGVNVNNVVPDYLQDVAISLHELVKIENIYELASQIAIKIIQVLDEILKE